LVNTLAYSGDGRMLVTGTMPRNNVEHAKATTVWDAATGRRLRDLPGSGFVAWRPGTAHLLSVYFDLNLAGRINTLAVGEWDPVDGRRLSSIPLPPPFSSVNGLTVSPDGALVAVSSIEGLTRVGRLRDGAPLATIRSTRQAATPSAYSAAHAVFAADGNLVTSAGKGDLQVWAMPSGRLLRDLISRSPAIDRRLAAVPGGMVYAPGVNGTVEAWYEPTGKALIPTPDVFNRPIRDLAVSADNRLFVTTGPQDVTTLFRGSADWLRHPVTATDARFDPTGRTIATGGSDGTLRFWAADGTTAGLPAAAHLYPEGIQSLAYARNGTLAVGVVDGTVHLRSRDGDDRTILRLGKGEVPIEARFSPDGSLLAVAVGTLAEVDDHGFLVVWDTRNHRERERLDTGTEEPSALTFSADGDHLIAATYRLVTGEDLTAHKQGGIRTWRTGDLSVVGSVSTGEHQVLSLAAGPDGSTLAVAGTNRRVELRRLSDQHLLRTLPHLFSVQQVVYSPDGRFLATSTTGDKLIRLWDARTGTLLAELTGNQGGGAYSLAFSPDGKILAASDPTGDVGLWHVDPADAVTRICRALGTTSGVSGLHSEAVNQICR
jgi:WD40 repeat protein